MAAPVRGAPPPHCLTRTAVRHARTHARTHGHTDTRTHNTRAHTHPPGRTHARQERAPGRHPRIGRRARARTSPAARVHTRSGGQCGGRCEAHAAPRAPARSRAPPRRSARGLLRRRRPRCAPGRRGAVPSPASTTCRREGRETFLKGVRLIQMKLKTVFSWRTLSTRKDRNPLHIQTHAF